MKKIVKKAVEAYKEEATDPNGSYTGITTDGSRPVQDADDL